MSNNLRPSPLAHIASLQAENKRIGHVPAPGDAGTYNRGWGRKILSIAPGTAYPLAVAGDCIYLVDAQNSTGGSATGNQLRAVDNWGNEMWLDRSRQGFIFPKPFLKLDIFNDSTDTIVANVYVGFGRVQTDSPDTFGFLSMGGTGQLTPITRPNNVTPYAAGQIVSQDPAISPAMFVEPLPFEKMYLNSIVLRTNNPTVAFSQFRLDFYSADPGSLADQDPAPFLMANQQVFVGSLDIPTLVTGGTGSDAAWFSATGMNIPFVVNPAGFYFIQLIALAAYVPVANQEFFIDGKFSVGF